MVALRALAALDDSFTLPTRNEQADGHDKNLLCFAAAAATNKREQMPSHCLSSLTRGFEFCGQAIKITI